MIQENREKVITCLRLIKDALKVYDFSLARSCVDILLEDSLLSSNHINLLYRSITFQEAQHNYEPKRLIPKEINASKS